jgi:hypothetical protein
MTTPPVLLRLTGSAAATAGCLFFAACGGGAVASPEPAPPAAAAVRPEHRGAPAGRSEVRTEAVDPAGWVRPTRACPLGVLLPPAAPRAAAPLPPDGGSFYAEADRLRWRQRIEAGPRAGVVDARQRSWAADWQRISVNAARFERGGEAATPADEGPARAVHGTLARDAAFHALVTDDARGRAAVRTYLLAQAASPANDFQHLCIRTAEGVTLDAWFWHASWLLRYMVTYDFVRAGLDAEDRSTIEAMVRRNAQALMAHLDWGNAQVFPKRLAGNYRVRARDAAPRTEADTWLARRYDTDGDCRITETDLAPRLPVYAYARADGSAGPRLSVLSQWFNNRKSAAATAFGIAGAMLGDSTLVDHARRYFMEWLSYAVWPDGSEGEYARNGDYCVAQQGVIYAASNLQGALLLAGVLARQGDDTLVAFSTRAGLFGSQSSEGEAPKSLERVARTQVALRTGDLDWHAHEPWRPRQAPGRSTALGAPTSRYMQAGAEIDNYHELGLLPAAALLPSVPIEGLVLRDPRVTAQRFPGSTGHPVATGFGQWTDVFNALPAVLLLAP